MHFLYRIPCSVDRRRRRFFLSFTICLSCSIALPSLLAPSFEAELKNVMMETLQVAVEIAELFLFVFFLLMYIGRCNLILRFHVPHSVSVSCSFCCSFDSFSALLKLSCWFRFRFRAQFLHRLFWRRDRDSAPNSSA